MKEISIKVRQKKSWILGPRIQKNGQIYSPGQIDLDFVGTAEILTKNSQNTWLKENSDSKILLVQKRYLAAGNTQEVD